jgi:hypothetical protein
MRTKDAPEGVNSGSKIYSHFDLDAQRMFGHLYEISWDEYDVRWRNYDLVRKQFGKCGPTPEFPTIYPIKLKNRQHVLDNLDIKLPGMWEDTFNLGNPLYKQLAFIPLDSRFDSESLTKLCNRIKELDDSFIAPNNSKVVR